MHFYEGADERAHVTMKLTLPPKLLAAPCAKLLNVFRKRADRARRAPRRALARSRSGAAIPPDTVVSELLGSSETISSFEAVRRPPTAGAAARHRLPLADPTVGRTAASEYRRGK